jgi:hypothetical protein
MTVHGNTKILQSIALPVMRMIARTGGGYRQLIAMPQLVMIVEIYAITN